MPNVKKFVINCLIIILISIPVCIGIIAYIEKQNTQSLYQDLQEKDKLITAALHSGDFSLLSGTNNDLLTPNYQSLKEEFIQVGKFLKLQNVRFVYAVRKNPEGVIFLLDSVNPNDAGYSAPGTLYTNPPQALIDSFDHPSSFTTGPYTDEYGTYISAYTPLYLPDGNLTAMIVMDIEYPPVLKTLLAKRLIMTCISIGSVLLIIIFYYFIFRIFEARRMIQIQQKELIESKNRLEESINNLEKERLISENRNKDLEKINSLMINRELKMIDLKKEIAGLKNKIS